MGDLHFLNWVRLVVFVFFASVTLDPTILNHGWTWMGTDKNEGCREAVGLLVHSDFSMVTSADREVF
jgi:hypothetical protein